MMIMEMQLKMISLRKGTQVIPKDNWIMRPRNRKAHSQKEIYNRRMKNLFHSKAINSITIMK